MVAPGGCVKNLEECDCICHRGGRCFPGPCCKTCPKCFERIRIFLFEVHIKNCQEKKSQTHVCVYCHRLIISALRNHADNCTLKGGI